MLLQIRLLTIVKHPGIFCCRELSWPDYVVKESCHLKAFEKYHSCLMHCLKLEEGHVLNEKHIKRAFDWELSIFNQGLANSLFVASAACTHLFIDSLSINLSLCWQFLVFLPICKSSRPSRWLLLLLLPSPKNNFLRHLCYN